MESLIRNARAKINLSLDVTGRRADGYHLVRMVMQTVDLYDTLTFTKRETQGIELHCSDPHVPTDSRNLVWKAADVLMRKYGISEGLRIDLEKKIPSAAGLAGGSSDAAATFQAVNDLFGLGLSMEELQAEGVKLGADIPYCLLGGTALSEGIGEVLTPLPDLPACFILLAKPAVDVATGAVYQALDDLNEMKHPDVDRQVKAIRNGNLPEVIKTLGNVLELVTAPNHPEIRRIESFMLANGAAGTRMSGSGPTVFGIYEERKKAEAAYTALKESGFTGNVFLTEPVGNGNGKGAEILNAGR